MNIVLYNVAYPVTALGPGARVAIWVAGCQLNCKGCITPTLQDPSSGQSIAVDTLANHLLSLPVPIDGLSLTGGEPFDQPRELAALVLKVRERSPACDVIAFWVIRLEG